MWIVYSVIAAVLWGLDYSLTEKVLQKMSFSTLLCIELFVAFLSMAVFSTFSGDFQIDLGTILKSERMGAYVAVIALTFTIANASIALSIGNKNATFAGLIEISYPLFIAFFSWKLFGQNDLSYGTWLGAGLVFIGIGLIYIFSR